MTTEDPVERILTAETWRDFCRKLEAAGDVLLDPRLPGDAFTRAEGIRYLTRLTRAALETFVENADPQAPELLRTCHETIKMGADNPDNHYQNAPISGKYQYELRGTRGTVHYLGFGILEGNYGASGSMATVSYLDAETMTFESDGSFVVHIGPDERPGNWLRTTPGSRTLVVRQTFHDRSRERIADLVLRRVDGPHAPRPLHPVALDRGLGASAKFVQGCASKFLEWAASLADHPNELPRFDPKVATEAGGVPDIAYYHGYYRLGPGEALVIEVEPPPCAYWNFQLNNVWMESLDYRYFPVHLNGHGAVADSSGTVRIVVSAEDPGIPNFLDTTGHTEGTMCLRWVRAERHPTPRTSVVAVAELRKISAEVSHGA